MNRILLLLLTTVLFTACRQKPASNGNARIVFDAGGLNFIASSLHPGQETMSALYGNDSARQSLLKGGQPAAGSVIKLVTWRFHDNPQYTGSKINGELLSVESIHTEAAGSIAYQLDFGALSQPAPATTRIQYILGYKPVSFP
ncbi:hypothetical protein [Chitinophaga qingshengii]|uniref:Uncharacterized protein n=1 Tax=Chitinophaga qingshengii TaxID=1569794 RepID=A0ABR7TGY0_9BACT|nr:hypothetical protein [Chitinophaga qingshengii]MBC9929220.1 hypothetical protein [Chitinophaga qingshengii]